MAAAWTNHPAAIPPRAWQPDGGGWNLCQHLSSRDPARYQDSAALHPDATRRRALELNLNGLINEMIQERIACLDAASAPEGCPIGSPANAVRLIFSEEAWQDYHDWQHQDRKILQRINRPIGEIERDPFQGIGKPEQLRHALTGYWSRRIDDEHRIAYAGHDGALLIAQLQHHD